MSRVPPPPPPPGHWVSPSLRGTRRDLGEGGCPPGLAPCVPSAPRPGWPASPQRLGRDGCGPLNAPTEMATVPSTEGTQLIWPPTPRCSHPEALMPQPRWPQSSSRPSHRPWDTSTLRQSQSTLRALNKMPTAPTNTSARTAALPSGPRSGWPPVQLEGFREQPKRDNAATNHLNTHL